MRLLLTYNSTLSTFDLRLSTFDFQLSTNLIMEFTDIGYSYLAPVLLVVLLFIKKEYKVSCKSILMATNVCLLFFVVSACREYYGLYLMAKNFGFNVSFEGLLKLASTNIPFAVKNLLVIILPLLFFSKKLSGSIIMTVVMIGLFWWDVASATIIHQPIHFPGYNYSPILFLILRFFCLLIAIYSFLWLVKRLEVN